MQRISRGVGQKRRCCENSQGSWYTQGDCFDNAAMESWNGSLKVEAIHAETFITREDAKKQVFEYIDVYYNRKRLHSTLGYVSPVSFEEQQVAQCGVHFFGVGSEVSVSLYASPEVSDLPPNPSNNS